MKKRLFITIAILIIGSVFVLSQDGEAGSGTVWTIISFIMTAIAALFARVWSVVNKKLGKAAVFSKEALDVGIAANDIVQHAKISLEDDKFDAVEIKGFTTKAQYLRVQVDELVAAFKDLFKKDPQ